MTNANEKVSNYISITLFGRPVAQPLVMFPMSFAMHNHTEYPLVLVAESFQSLLGLGLTDAPGQYTFWDYQAGAWQKNWGLRIYHLLLSPQASDRLIDVGIDSYVRGWEKPSDHVPVWADLDLEVA